jgi:hypothetical protein
MSQEAVPEQAAASANPVPQSVPGQQAAPKGLLQQMEELMAALTADLSQLDADLQTTGDRPPPPGSTTDGTGTTSGTNTTGAADGHRESPRTGRSEGHHEGHHYGHHGSHHDGNRDRSR